MTRLPTRIHFPFGYVVRIKQITVTEMRVLSDGGPDLDGCWVADERTIYIVRSLPAGRKRYILGHEMFHSLVDFQHACLNDRAMKP